MHGSLKSSHNFTLCVGSCSCHNSVGVATLVVTGSSVVARLSLKSSPLIPAPSMSNSSSVQICKCMNRGVSYVLLHHSVSLETGWLNGKGTFIHLCGHCGIMLC